MINRKFDKAYKKNMKETVKELKVVYSNWLKKWNELVVKELTIAYNEDKKYAKKSKIRKPKRKR